MRSVEQITPEGDIVLAPDTKKSVSEIRDILSRYLEVLNERNPFEVSIDGRRFLICAKSITYLGYPHPEHKKRIQIPGSWQEVLRKENAFLLGVYSYGGRNLFALFDTSRYRRNRLNNSSAHVHTIDLVSALRYGTFRKTDARGNQILVFTEERLKDVFTSLARREAVLLAPDLEVVDSFSKQVPSRWVGKRCYDEMLAAGFPDALQAEWPGFYLEHAFSAFLARNPETYGARCRYVKDKARASLDFDLAFSSGFLGDLKTHEISSAAILGNDLASVSAALERDGRLWYVIVSHSSEKDRDKGFALTRYWNKLLSERKGSQKDELSYGQKMKHAADLKEVLVAEINLANRKHLKTFSQGMNSNGTPRAIKAMISKRDMDDFVIYRRAVAA